MKKFATEFKEFITKGNALDLAIGVVIGGAFGAIVKSLVEDLIMPIVGLFLGNVNIADRFVQLNKAARRRGQRIAPTMRNRYSVTQRGRAKLLARAKAVEDPSFAVDTLTVGQKA